MQIHVYELKVPPNATEMSEKDLEVKFTKALTGVVDSSLPCPIFDNHGQRSHPRIDFHICLDHSRVLQRQGVVDVHVASQAQLWVPYFDNGYFCG